MGTAKIAISLDRELLDRIDRLVSERKFSSRSRAIQLAVQAQIERLDRRRLSSECAKLDPRFEQAVAEEGASYEIESWPEY
jgi:metal-responsive CopG/Arc/MetJ family transcriptional regulator